MERVVLYTFNGIPLKEVTLPKVRMKICIIEYQNRYFAYDSETGCYVESIVYHEKD
jgi:hypothetical protein